MSIPSIEMNTGDLSPSIVATMQNNDGTIFDLTGCSVKFQLSQNNTVLFTKTASVKPPATGGVVQYDWSSGDTAYYGVCTGLFLVTLSTGQTQTFPTIGVFYIIFPLQPTAVPSAPAFTTLSEVMAHLNVQGPDATGTYTVYGLPVSQQGLQAQIDHANMYVNSLVSGVQTGDPRYPFAMLAALDIACMGVLTAASGGMLIGATDYRLGDLFVTKASIGKFAYQAAFQAYSDDLAKVLMNFTTVAVSAPATLGQEVPYWRGALVNP